MKKGYRVLLVFAMALLLTVVCRTGVQAASDVTLKNGKWVSGTFTSEETDQYYKINVKKTGYIKVEYSRTSKSGTVFDFCNSKKAVISAGCGDWKKNQSVSYIGVKKGVYYIYVASAVNGTEDYKIRYTFKAMKAVTGFKTPKKAMSKATVLKKNKEVSSVIFPAEKNAEFYYYKLVVPKKQKVKIYTELMAQKSSSTLWLTIEDEKGHVLTSNKQNEMVYKKDSMTYWEYDGTEKGSKEVITETLDQGTYYVAVSVLNKGDTGYFKIKLK